MNKKFSIILLVISLLISGCQLAKQEVPQTGNDILVGALITEDYLDLNNFEISLNPITGSPTIKHNTSTRIYAELVDDPNDLYGGKMYQFPGLNGMLLASCQVQPHGENTEPYWTTQVTGGICDVLVGHHTRDEGFSLTLEGTVYCSDRSANGKFYVNPVYQTPDGQVYLMPGDGIMFDGMSSVSSRYRLTDTQTQTENDIAKTNTCEIVVNLQAVTPAESLMILEVDEYHHILKETTLSPNEVPASLVPDQNCAYIVIEEHFADEVRRNLYDFDDSKATWFLATSSGVCEKIAITLEWPNK